MYCWRIVLIDPRINLDDPELLEIRNLNSKLERTPNQNLSMLPQMFRR